MIDKINKVKKFHEAFLIGNEDKPRAIVDESIFLLRHRLMQEENQEYLEACKNGDLVEIADALGDMLYIWCGTVLKHGMQDVICEIFDEIQKSNMSKLDKNNKPIFREDGKVMKGDNYFKPNIKSILLKHVESI
ncbi:MAG: hypothetical protein CMP55_03230 [Flavobacteriales bacterium]|nr:hypothetical protein [Flavobacteriales bacterium]|tara:strand:+ start:3674 stop:4075 length:402 start_codon:yes stop_codon:yes gene_type:complete